MLYCTTKYEPENGISASQVHDCWLKSSSNFAVWMSCCDCKLRWISICSQGFGRGEDHTLYIYIHIYCFGRVMNLHESAPSWAKFNWTVHTSVISLDIGWSSGAICICGGQFEQLILGFVESRIWQWTNLCPYLSLSLVSTCLQHVRQYYHQNEVMILRGCRTTKRSLQFYILKCEILIPTRSVIVCSFDL